MALLPGSRSLEGTSTATGTLARDGSASYAFYITWDVEPMEPAPHTSEELVQLTSVVKLSDEDAEWLYPEKALEETATHILDLGAELAVITRGPSGSLLATPPPPSAFQP